VNPEDTPALEGFNRIPVPEGLGISDVELLKKAEWPIVNGLCGDSDTLPREVGIAELALIFTEASRVGLRNRLPSEND
jgi:hypothetical protein